MRKRLFTAMSLLLVVLGIMAEGRAKYVFYFIGDGMGVNQVNAAETYLGAVQGRIGIEPLCFPSFPYSAMVNTQSATNGVTDSSAGGTALACGKKTKNGVEGMLKDQSTPITSIAQWAHNGGAAVGVTTSVSIDHATPAAFYSHVPDRNMYYEIGTQLSTSGFDFFGGSDFLKPDNPKGGDDLYKQTQDAGYTIARGYKDYQKKCKKADRMVLFSLRLQARTTAAAYHTPSTVGRTTLPLPTSHAQPSTSLRRNRTPRTVSSSWWRVAR